MKTLTMQQKVLTSAFAVVSLAIFSAAAASGTPSTWARAMLTASCMGLLTWWLGWNRSPGKPKFSLKPRMHVVQRVGLAQRTSMALVEIDGESFLVVHGDAFASIRRTPTRRVAAEGATP